MDIIILVYIFLDGNFDQFGYSRFVADDNSFINYNLPVDKISSTLNFGGSEYNVYYPLLNDGEKIRTEDSEEKLNNLILDLPQTIVISSTLPKNNQLSSYIESLQNQIDKLPRNLNRSYNKNLF